MRIVVLTIALMIGCGASSATSGAGAAGSGSGGAVSPDDRSVEVDPQECATDADCMIGTPRGCCSAYCPEDRQAWSSARWAEYQADCAVEECAVLEDAACRDVELPDAIAVCVRERCTLTLR